MVARAKKERGATSRRPGERGERGKARFERGDGTDAHTHKLIDRGIDIDIGRDRDRDRKIPATAFLALAFNAVMETALAAVACRTTRPALAPV